MTKNKLKNTFSTEENNTNFDKNVDEQAAGKPKFAKNMNQIIGLGVFFFGMMLLLSMISYIWTGRQDQSVIESLSLFEIFSSGKEAANWLRLFGAYTSHLFIFQFLGAASYIVPFFVILSGADLIRNLKFRYRLFYGLLFIMFWLSLALGYIALKVGSDFQWGYFCGNLGYTLAEGIDNLVGFGTVFVLIFSPVIFAWYFDMLNLEKLSKIFETKNKPVQKQTREFASENPQNEPKNSENKANATQTSETPLKKSVFAEDSPKIDAEKEDSADVEDEAKTDKPKVESIRLSRDPEEKKREAERLKALKTAEAEKNKNSNEETNNFTSHATYNDFETEDEEDYSDENAYLQPAEKEDSEVYQNFPPDDDDFSQANILTSEESQNRAADNNQQAKEESDAAKRIFSVQKEEPKFLLDEQHIDPVNALPFYRMPGIELLDVVKTTKQNNTDEEIYENIHKIAKTLEAFKISITNDVRAEIGPTVTLYEIVPAPGIKIAQIRKVADDIALSLSAIGIRIIAPMPGRGTIGIEVPNKNREKVSLRALIESETFSGTKKELPIVFGKTISNDIFITDLAKMPHLLIGGATGQGKSVGINVVLTSLLYKKHPGELKFVLIDPKKVEFSIYDKLHKHYLAQLPDSKSPVITDADESLRVLDSLCLEMDNRYELLKNSDCRQLLEYNKKFENGELDLTTGNRFLPYIVVIIDELADLMITTNKTIERPIARLAQMARAVGIHLVVATQRPSVNVITGVIKANFPARMAFKVSSKTDSRVILDVDGAEQLLGMGDMLLTNGSDIIRLQCAFVDTMEVERITNFIGEQGGYNLPYYLPEVIDPNKPKPQQFNLKF